MPQDITRIWVYHPESSSFFTELKDVFYSEVNQTTDLALCNVVGPAVEGTKDELKRLLAANGWSSAEINKETASVKEDKKETAMPQQDTTKKGPTAEQVIAAYIKTRDEIEAKEKAVKAEVAELKAIQEKRAMWLMGTMDNIGATSLKGVAGTCFIDWKDSATVADSGAFLDWVHSDWEKNKTFLENRVSKTAVKQRLEDGETPPPGVKYTKVKDIKIRRS